MELTVAKKVNNFDLFFVCPHNIQNISETYLRNIYIFLLHEDQN